MKVLLINPSERNMVGANLPLEVEAIRGANPPISLQYVAAACQKAGHETAIIDAALDNLSPAALARRIAEYEPEVVGIGAVSFTMPDALVAARAAQQAAPRAAVVFGGIQPFLYPEETIRLPDIDLALIGEGESTMPPLLETLEAGGDFGDVPGLVWELDDHVGINPAPPRIEDMDSIPFPARDLLPIDGYESLITDRKPVHILVTSRGCPFRCRFCSRSITGKRFRAHSPDYVLEEMRLCAGMGIRYLIFYDEVFSIDRKRTMAICEKLIEARLPIKFLVRATVATVNEEMLRALKAAGCDMITYGVEASDPDVLEELGKPYTIDQVKQAFRLTNKVGLPNLAYFMIGNPGEEERHVHRSARMAAELKPDMVHVSIFTPYPATDTYEKALAQGIIRTDYWRDFARNPTADFKVPPWPGPIPEPRLHQLLDLFYRKFYLRPSVVLRRLLRSGGRGLGQDIQRALVLAPKASDIGKALRGLIRRRG